MHRPLLSNKKTSARITLNKPLVFSFLALIAVGLVMVASASSPIASENNGFAGYFFVKQAIFTLIAIAALLVALKIPTSFWQKFKWFWVIVSIVLLTMVLIPGIGHIVNGSRRWLGIGPIAIQASELVKLTTILYMANYLNDHPIEIQTSFIGIIRPLAVLAIMGILLLMQPDFGATVVLFATALGMMLMAKVPIRWFLLLLVLVAIASIILIFVSPYRLARLTGFLNPWANQYSSGYQLTQSLIAFGRGGIWGLGLGNSIQKLFFLPEAHTDFIFAIFSEEFGLWGALLLIGLYATLLLNAFRISMVAEKSQTLFNAYLGYGITFWLGIQMVVNMGVNMGILPTKGLTLPLISYGGSSLVINCFVIGLLLRIDYQNKT